MGAFDNLVDGEKVAQVKCYLSNLETYKVGDKVPKVFGYSNYTILLPYYESVDFAIIRKGRLVALTNDKRRLVKPFIDKWGGIVEKLEDFKNPFEEVVKEVKESLE